MKEEKCLICGSTKNLRTMVYQNRKGYVTLCSPHQAKLIHIMNCYMNGDQIIIRRVKKYGGLK